jgi:hypothetical protein
VPEAAGAVRRIAGAAADGPRRRTICQLLDSRRADFCAGLCLGQHRAREQAVRPCPGTVRQGRWDRTQGRAPPSVRGVAFVSSLEVRQ